MESLDDRRFIKAIFPDPYQVEVWNNRGEAPNIDRTAETGKLVENISLDLKLFDA